MCFEIVSLGVCTYSVRSAYKVKPFVFTTVEAPASLLESARGRARIAADESLWIVGVEEFPAAVRQPVSGEGTGQ